MRLSGAIVFRLHDTHGFPAELTMLECKERGVEIDWRGFVRSAKAAGWKDRRIGALLNECGVRDGNVCE